jgi:hypothetical protein
MDDRYLVYTRDVARATRRTTTVAKARVVAAPCRNCGQEFFIGKRNGRQREFCSNACRQSHFRNAEFGRRYQTPDPLRNTEKTAATSVACQGPQGGRAFPIDLLGGGYRWPGSAPLDPDLRRKIVAAELPTRRRPA